MVDGFSIGDVQEVVIRDRQMLAQDGMFVIIASINTVTCRLKKSPDIISRGFVYIKENKDLIEKTRMKVKKIVKFKRRSLRFNKKQQASKKKFKIWSKS